MSAKEKLQSLYETHHKTKGRYGYLFCHGKRAPYLQKWIGQGKKILDLGCRDGALTKHYVKNNEVLGVDIDQKALEITKKNLHIDTLWLDVNTEWPFAPHSFDVIVACEIVEHLFYAQDFLEKIANTLTPQGIFVGSVPNAFRMRNRWKFLFGKNFETDPTHVRMFSSCSLYQFLHQKFSHIEIAYVQGKILPFLPVASYTPPFLNRLFCRDLLWKASFSQNNS